MRVKHKDAPKHQSDPSMPLIHWHAHYLPNNKYLNYSFYDVPEIMDLYRIDEKTGDLVYVMSDFEFITKTKVREQPNKYVQKPHDSKYLDENLMPSKLAFQLSTELSKRIDKLPLEKNENQSLFKKIRDKIQATISPKNHPTPTPFTKYEKWSLILMGMAVIIPIILYIIS